MGRTVARPYLVLGPEEHVVLGQSDFGMPGLTAVEAIGPFVGIQASGPLITVHDSIIEAGLGIGHHPHRYNERLFYIEQGQLDHDDALNHITGHMDTGDVGQFTEGRRGMVHSEWNHGNVGTRAYILVYSLSSRACVSVTPIDGLLAMITNSSPASRSITGPSTHW